MSDAHLDLHNVLAVTDFIDSVVEYLPEKDRAPYQKLAEDLHGGKKVKAEIMAEMAKNLGAATWPARFAMKEFLASTGIEMEWDAVMKAVRPTTALLLKRLRKNVGMKTLDETLDSSDAPMAIHESEETEIDLVREEVHIELFQEHRKNLAPMVKEAQVELEAMKKWLKQLRDVAGKIPKEQSLILSKLEHYEDRIYFDGEKVPLDILDKEVGYFKEDEAIPPTDDALIDAETLPVRFEVEEGTPEGTPPIAIPEET
jgi:predicted HTH domain antitoxin